MGGSEGEESLLTCLFYTPKLSQRHPQVYTVKVAPPYCGQNPAAGKGKQTVANVTGIICHRIDDFFLKMSQLMLKVPSATLLSILPTTFSSNNPFTSALMTCFSGVQTQKCNEINTRHVQFTLSATIVIVKVACFTQVTSFQISTLALKRIKRNHGADRGSKRCCSHVS